MNREPTIFIVDDDEAVRDSLSMMLRAAGRSVETFAPPRNSSTSAATPTGGVRGDRHAHARDERPRAAGVARRAQQHPADPVPDRPRRHPDGGANDQARCLRFPQKPVDETQLLAAIDSAMSGGVSDESTRTLPPAVASLSKREAEVLDLILDGRQTRGIAEALFISVKTVSSTAAGSTRSSAWRRWRSSSISAWAGSCGGRWRAAKRRRPRVPHPRRGGPSCSSRAVTRTTCTLHDAPAVTSDATDRHHASLRSPGEGAPSTMRSTWLALAMPPGIVAPGRSIRPRARRCARGRQPERRDPGAQAIAVREMLARRRLLEVRAFAQRRHAPPTHDQPVFAVHRQQHARCPLQGRMPVVVRGAPVSTAMGITGAATEGSECTGRAPFSRATSCASGGRNPHCWSTAERAVSGTSDGFAEVEGDVRSGRRTPLGIDLETAQDHFLHRRGQRQDEAARRDRHAPKPVAHAAITWQGRRTEARR